jgi:hypothetical protein
MFILHLNDVTLRTEVQSRTNTQILTVIRLLEAKYNKTTYCLLLIHIFYALRKPVQTNVLLSQQLLLLLVVLPLLLLYSSSSQVEVALSMSDKCVCSS